MVTLIAVHNSDGCVGRCEAKCYEALHPGCDCICGGQNHGAGFDKAVENTRELAETWIEEYTERKNLSDCRGEIIQVIDQFDLFNFESVLKKSSVPVARGSNVAGAAIGLGGAVAAAAGLQSSKSLSVKGFNKSTSDTKKCKASSAQRRKHVSVEQIPLF